MIPINAKALTGSVSITCDDESYSMNETATCKVTGQSDEEVYSISGKINNDFISSVSTTKFTTDNGSWQGDGDDGNIQLYTDKGKKGTFNIGTFTIKPKEKNGIIGTDITIEKIKFSDTNGKEFDIKDAQTTISFVGNIGTNSSNNSNKTSNSSIKNPSTADTKIALVFLGIMASCSLVVFSYRKLRKCK